MTKCERLFSYAILSLILCSCASMWPARKESDERLLYMAKAELSSVQTGLLMYLFDGGEDAYPSTAAINSYRDLQYVLSNFVQLPDEDQASFTFHSYARAQANTFVLKTRARDSKRTIITVTPTSITPSP